MVVPGWCSPLPSFAEKLVNEKSVDPDQTSSSAASDLGVHCLPSTLLLDARFGWVQLI